MWNRLINFLAVTLKDKHRIIAGMLFASYFCIVCGMGASCLVPVIVVALLEEFIGMWRHGLFDWHGLVATLLGGVPIAIFAVL